MRYVIAIVVGAALASAQIPPRAAPADYEHQAKAGAVTIAAEFTGHTLPTAEGPLNTDEYIGVEVGVFGGGEARFNIAAGEFSLRLNGKKVIPSAQFGSVARSLKDPDWLPPEGLQQQKSKTSMGTGGGGSEPPPKPPEPAIELKRAWAQRVQKAALPEGDRALPQAGLLFFQHRGKTENLQSVELMYEGAAGKAVLKLK